MTTRTVGLEVNGEAVEITVEPRVTLADALRDQLGLVGTHLGCEQGVCGACTVLVDGAAVRSCLLFAVQAAGREVTTVEGLEQPDGDLHALQESFLRNRAFQCGFCTPGMMMGLAGLEQRGRQVTRDQLREYLSGHICRCTGYEAIVEAATEYLDHADLLRKEDPT